jgi:hypothetical protein
MGTPLTTRPLLLLLLPCDEDDDVDEEDEENEDEDARGTSSIVMLRWVSSGSGSWRKVKGSKRAEA